MESMLMRILILVLGYTYPAYECFKAIEFGRPDMEQLQLWCQYWIILAILTVLERVGDIFISWLPLYSEMKLAFIVYLWHPKTKGTTHVYATFLKPFVSRHVVDIDGKLQVLRQRMLEMSGVFWKKFLVYAELKFFELLQYMASQSPHAASQLGLSASQSYPPVSKFVYLVQAPHLYQQQPPQSAHMPPGYQMPLLQTAHKLQPLAPKVLPGLSHAQLSASVVPCEQKNYEEEEEMDYEWVDANELAAPASTNMDGLPVSKRAQWMHFNSWWQRSYIQQ